MWHRFLQLIGVRSRYTKLTFHFVGGTTLTADKVIDWEVKHQGGPIVALSIKQKPSAKYRLVVASVNLSTVAAIVQH
jgi:hypothetical protein